MRFKPKSPTSDCIPPRYMLYMIYNKIFYIRSIVKYLIAHGTKQTSVKTWHFFKRTTSFAIIFRRKIKQSDGPFFFE
jgi:hypothetical protein